MMLLSLPLQGIYTPFVSLIRYSGRKSYYSLYLKPIHISLPPKRLIQRLHSSSPNDISRSINQLFKTGWGAKDMERQLDALAKSRISEFEFEHVADCLFQIARHKLRINLPFKLFTKKMKEIGAKNQSLEIWGSYCMDWKLLPLAKSFNRSMTIRGKSSISWLPLFR